MSVQPHLALEAAVAAVSPATPENVPRVRTFGQPRRSSSLNASIDTLGATCSKCGPAASASSPAEHHQPEPPRGGAAASLMSPGAATSALMSLGAAAQPAAATPVGAGAAHYRGDRLKLAQSHSQPMVSLRSLPTTEVTKHPGVKNTLKVWRLPRPSLRPAAAATGCASELGLALVRR